MSDLTRLKNTSNLIQFSKLLGFEPHALSYILYKIPDDKKYSEFTILKKNGDNRLIKAPIQQLKLLQNRLALLLKKCYDEISQIKIYRSSLSHGFRSGHSITTNASKHIKRRYVFSVDLKDFFPSINFGRVRGFFIKDKNFELNEKVATLIAQIACHNNELPQGSPCSPIISNFIGHLLDVRMACLAKKNKCTYSRYADDLTFSTNRKDFPIDIAVNIHDNEWVPGTALNNEIRRLGFLINDKKTSLQYKTSRQIVTGLVVNKKTNIKREYYKLCRSMCHELFNKDALYFNIKSADPVLLKSQNVKVGDDKGVLHIDRRSMNHLEGVLSYIYFVKRDHDNRKTNHKHHDPHGIIKVYRQFLFYKHFYYLNKPLIICEGKTDPIYIKCALRQLHKDYPVLIQKEDNKYKYGVDFLKFTENFKEVFSISHGTSGLKAIMEMYQKYMEAFKGVGRRYPVIMLVDNDEGADDIIKNIKKWPEYKNGNFPSVLRYCENLYISIIPRGEDGKQRAIEDLFDKKTLNIEVAGKVFGGKSPDKKKEYSKVVFAEKVVKANEGSIDFSEFSVVLNMFMTAIEDYKIKS